MPTPSGTYSIPIQPVLSPALLMASPHSKALPFPLNAPGVQFTYLARNAVYWLAHYWSLREQEVLFPDFFNGAELEALLAAGVRIRFYPVHTGMRVDVQDIADRISPQTRAVFLIHYSGFPGPVEEVAALCKERGVRLIENCALALLSCIGERPLGSFGDAAVFCLHKPLPLTNGGALILREGRNGKVLVSRDPSVATVAGHVVRQLMSHFALRGKSASLRAARVIHSLGQAFTGAAGVKRVSVCTSSFDVTSANLGISRLSLRVLTALDYAEIARRRRSNFQYLAERLDGIVSPIFRELPPGVCPLSFPIRVENRAEVTERLVQLGIEAVPLWARHHPILPEGSSPEVDDMRRTSLKLPCHQDLTNRELDRVVEGVKLVLAGCEVLTH